MLGLLDRIPRWLGGTRTDAAWLIRFMSRWLLFATLTVFLGLLATGGSPQQLWDAAIQATAEMLPSKSLPGFLYVEAPQLYTRERLVNDRFRQANWLNAELEATTKPDSAE